MAEANAEHRRMGGRDLTDGGRCIGHRVWIAWPVGQKHPVWVHCEDAIGRRVRRHNGDPAIVRLEQAQNVPLDPVVVRHHMIGGIRLSPNVCLTGGYHRREIEAFHAWAASKELQGLAGRRVTEPDDTTHDAG